MFEFQLGSSLLGQEDISDLIESPLSQLTCSNRRNWNRRWINLLVLSFCLALWSSQLLASAPAQSSVSCGNPSMTGSGARACSVYLSGAATSTVIVSLSSDNAAVTVPAAITVWAGASHTGFNASV